MAALCVSTGYLAAKVHPSRRDFGLLLPPWTLRAVEASLGQQMMTPKEGAVFLQ